MFKCDNCKRITQPREKLTKYPVEYRDRVYQYERKRRTIATYGKEIVKEINLCEDCAKKLKNLEAN